MGATDHEIYKKRGKLNVQIAILLLVFVGLSFFATLAKINNGERGPAKNAAVDVPTADEVADE